MSAIGNPGEAGVQILEQGAVGNEGRPSGLTRFVRRIKGMLGGHSPMAHSEDIAPEEMEPHMTSEEVLLADDSYCRIKLSEFTKLEKEVKATLDEETVLLLPVVDLPKLAQVRESEEYYEQKIHYVKDGNLVHLWPEGKPARQFLASHGYYS